jgi:hypothetical protein
MPGATDTARLLVLSFSLLPVVTFGCAPSSDDRSAPDGGQTRSDAAAGDAATRQDDAATSPPRDAGSDSGILMPADSGTSMDAAMPNDGGPGDVVEPEDPFVHESGSRLRAIYLRADGQDERRFAQPLGDFFDRDLDAPCWVVEDEDGWHCNPAMPTNPWYFSDPDCTERLFEPTGAWGARYLRVEGEILPFTDPYDDEADVYAGSGDGDCMPSDRPSELYRVGAPLAPERLARFTTERVVTGTAVDGLIGVAADGARKFLTLIDRETDRPCTWLRSAVDETVRCWPIPSSSGIYAEVNNIYQNPDCTGRAGRVFGGFPSEPFWLRESTSLPELCADGLRFYVGGDRLEQVYYRQNDDCLVRENDLAGVVVARGDEVSPGAFQEASETNNAPARLAYALYALADFRVQVGFTLDSYDRTLDTECTITRTGETTIHCVPSLEANLRYATDDCSGPQVLRIARDADPVCGPKLTHFYDAAGARVLTAGAEIETDHASYQQSYAGECLASGTEYLHAIAEELPLDALVALELVIE